MCGIMTHCCHSSRLSCSRMQDPRLTSHQGTVCGLTTTAPSTVPLCLATKSQVSGLQKVRQVDCSDVTCIAVVSFTCRCRLYSASSSAEGWAASCNR
jgi:hypothetical protein